MASPPEYQRSSTPTHSSASSAKPSTSPVPTTTTTVADTFYLPSSFAFSGTNVSNPLGNSRYETEVTNSYLKELRPLTLRAIELKSIITNIKNRVSPSDEELIQLASLEEEFQRVKDKSMLLSSQLVMLNRRALVRFEHYEEAAKRQEEERETRQKEVAQ
ncbi:hypothetical protein HDU76_005488, partial [Blyttiomyces sp. JEL0837]